MTSSRAIAIFLLVGTLVPLANVIPGGETDSLATARLSDWLLGTLLCAVVGVLAAYVQHLRRQRGAPPAVAVATVSDESTSARAPVALILVALLVYAQIAQGVFSGRPLLIDEIVQVLQARMYASGNLAMPVTEPRAFFSILHLVDLGDRVYGQYPAGGPAMLVPGALLGVEWLTGPVAGALAVWCFWLLTRESDPLASRQWRLGATALFAVAPFGAFMFGSHMNHATALLWILVAVVWLARAVRPERARWRDGLICGLGLGVAATIRPVDAAAFALPAAVWLLWRARHGGQPLKILLASGVGVAIPMLALFWVNAETTGHPLRFGYDLLWGRGHGLGFHASPWGPVHTPARGVELVSLYLTRLSTYLFETPYPSLLPAIVGLWLARGLNALDRYLAVSGAMLLLGYWAYWHDGFYLGPRFVFALLPVLVLWSARSWPLVRDRLGAGSLAWRGVRVAIGFGALYAIFSIATVRVPSYQNGMTSMRLQPEASARAASIDGALVLVQESWGAQLVVRMWEAGVSRSDGEALYRSIDACQLELALRASARAGERGAEVVARLRPLAADSAQLIPSTRSPDFTEKMLPSFAYPPVCEARLVDDQRGFLHLAPWRLANDNNVYARWLPGREEEISAAFAGRPVYRVRRAGPEVGAPLVWERWVGVDSAGPR